MSDSPFVGPGDEPRLVECAVLFFDLLGVSAMAQGAKAEVELERFNRNIRSAFPYEIGAAAASREGSPYPATVFSDSVVQSVPIIDDLSAAKAIFQVVVDVAQLQTELATHDYFARGALTLDRIHSYDGLLFGPALVEAVSLERDVAVDPRIVLSPAASAALLEGAAAEGPERVVYEEAPILVDEDGVPFVDYLSGAFQFDIGFELPDRMREHRDAVVKQLERQRTSFSRWSKHRWVAEYHNAICHTYRKHLAKDGGIESFLIDSIHTTRRFEPLRNLASKH